MAAWLGSSDSSLSAGPGSGLVNECEPLYFMVVLLWRGKFGCGQGMRVPARRKAAARLLPPTNRPPKKETAILALPLPRTGRAQSGCYLASTMDCSAGLSAEHYMSKSVLEALGDIVAVEWRSMACARRAKGDRRQQPYWQLLVDCNIFHGKTARLRKRSIHHVYV